MSYSEIVDWIQEKHGVRLSKSSVSEWLRGVHSPYNGRYVPSIDLLKPSEELAYIIGVKLGDGYTKKSHDYVKIGLKVKDREFALEFARCLVNVLERLPKEPGYDKPTKKYVVEVASKTLYDLLKSR